MDNNNQNTVPLHVGTIVKKYLNKHRIFKSVLGRRIGKADSTIARYQKSVSLQAEILLVLSHALQHNFFADIAALLPAHYTTDSPIDATNANRIADLELQVKILEAEKAVLLEALKKG